MAAARTRSRFDREEAGPRNDVYTGLLTISLVAMIVSCLLLYLDYSQYSGPAPKVTVPPQQAPRTAGGGGGGGGSAAAPIQSPQSIAAVPARLPEPVAMGAPEPVELAPVIAVAAELPAVPQQVTPAVAETPAPQLPTPVAAVDVPTPAPQPLTPVAAVQVPTPAPQMNPQPVVEAPRVTPIPEPTPAPPAVAAKSEPAVPQLQLSDPPPMPKLRSTGAPTPTPAPAPTAKLSDTDPPPLPKSIRQLPPK